MTSRTTMALLAALGLCGCDSDKPTGQVAAVVNGAEITRGELRTEATASGAAMTGETAPELLQDIVDRKLLAQEAAHIGLDKQVDYILAQHRAEEALLANFLARTVANAVPYPTDDDVDRFLSTHPNAFASNTRFDIEQLDFQPADNPAAAALTAKAPTLDAAEQVLLRQGVAYQRSRTQWNSLFMPADLATRLGTLAPDTPFVQRQGDRALVGVVLARETTPLDYRRREIFARKSLRQRLIAAATERRLTQLRDAATIRYQPGFEPR